MRFCAFLILLCTALLTGCGGSGGSTNAGNSYGFTPGQNLTIPITQGTVLVPGNSFANPGSVQSAESPAPNFEQQHRVVDEQKLTLTLPDAPAATITVSYPDTHPDYNLGAVMFAGNAIIGGFPAIRQNGRVIVQLDPELIAAAQSHGPKVQGRGTSIVVSLLLTFLTVVDSPDQTPSLEQVGLETDKSHVAIFSHGLLQQGSDMTPSAQMAQARAGNSAVYVYHYNDQEPIAQAARDLAFLVRQLNLPPKSMVLWGYSKGALVNLHMLVIEGETLATKQAVFLAGPFEGCQLDLFGLYLFLNTAFFTTNVGVPLIGSPHDNCLAELMPGSDTLTALANATGGQHGDVEYYFFAGGTDNVVSQQSATFANSTVPENLTNGNVYRNTIPNHGHLAMDEPDVISTVIGQLHEKRTGISVWSTVNGQVVNTVQPDNGDGSWYYSIHIRNNTGENITVQSLQLEAFDRYGAWNGNQWYDPNSPIGVFYPTEYVAWNQYLAANMGLPAISVQTWASGQGLPVWSPLVPPSNKAINVRYRILAKGQSGQIYQNEWDVRCCYGNIQPVWPPNGRAPEGPPTGNPSPSGKGR